MPPFSSPNREYPTYSSSFVRIGDEIFVADPNSFHVPSDVLFFDDSQYGTNEKFQATRNPADRDAGKIVVDNVSNIISVVGDSGELKVPENYQARNMTRDALKRRVGGEYEVKKDKHHQIYPRENR
jgi:hypothetical protein